MSTAQTMVIVGASLAGAKAAETLREEGFDGRLLLIGEEPERPYERPPLSKDYLRGEVERSKVYVHDEAFYAANAIDLRTSCRVEAIDARAGEVVLHDGERVPYDRLLLTVGAAPRSLPVPGGDLAGVLYLRTLGDSDDLAARLEAGGHVVVIGAGWIGAEAAASARQKGLDVTLLEQAAVPLERVLGTEVGAVYRDIHSDQGVRFLGGAGVESLEGSGQVERVRLTDGTVIACDFVVAGVGVTPRTELAAHAGLTVDNGIVVDELLTTSAPTIFAAGDVANAYHPFFGTHIRVEHWANALNQGPAAARAMLGKGTGHDRLPYFFSDQYDIGMEYSGYVTAWDRVVLRGDPATREFIAFWVKHDRVLAGMNVNVWDVAEPIQALIRSRRAIDDARLADPDVPLEDLTAPA
jgi:3-phenylpropionate/trans-cinnamate dioxygenase ferredoxin reductase component